MRRLLLCLLLCGCVEFPELGDTISPDIEQAPFMEFLTVDELAALEADRAILEDLNVSLAARISQLKARAAAIRGSVFNAADRARLSGQPG